MRNKDHIWRLPTGINYSEMLPKSGTSDKLAISIPLFSSSFQFIKEAKSREYFKQVHVKGAVWSALSMLHNTDLGKRGVKVYFHVEESVLKTAKIIFDAMGVTEDHIRVVKSSDIHGNVKNVKNLRYGKKFACLFDDLLISNWLVMDSDAFACTEGDKIELYDLFESPWVLNNPVSFNYFLNKFTYQHWIDRIYDAIGKKPNKDLDLWKQEIWAFKSVGLDIDNKLDAGKDGVVRPINKTVMFALGRESGLADFLRENIHRCCEDEFLIAMWSLTNPILSLSSMTSLPMFYSAGDYIKSSNFYQYMHHVIFEAHDSNPFFARFYRDMTRHIPLEENKNLTAWKELHEGQSEK